MNKIASYLLLSALITNNPYAPDCYTSTTTIHMGEMKKKQKKTKKPFKISGKCSTPAYHHFAELSVGKPAQISKIT